MNKELNAEIETIFIITPAELSHISSTILRDIIKNGGDIFISSGVDKIYTQNNACKGVILENGDKIESDYVISSAGIQNTLNKFLIELIFFSEIFRKSIPVISAPQAPDSISIFIRSFSYRKEVIIQVNFFYLGFQFF